MRSEVSEQVHALHGARWLRGSGTIAKVLALQCIVVAPMGSANVCISVHCKITYHIDRGGCRDLPRANGGAACAQEK
eukprot:1292585-Pyramimonas_sp.AAC.1